MGKVKYFVLVVASVFLLTGCVKFNATMDIKKDKSMNFSIIYAMDTSFMQGEELIDEAKKKELEKEGFTISEYSDDSMKGFKIERKIKNIDEVSSEKDTEYDLSFNDANKKMFKVKKGFLKNTYTAKFNFNSSNDIEMDETEEGFDFEDEDFEVEDTEEGTDSDFPLDPSVLGEDYAEMMKKMDLSFNVNLPYKAISSNATTKDNNGKTLKWPLTATSASIIEFEFALYNMTVIYLIAGAVVLVAIVIVAVVVLKNKNTKKAEVIE